MTQEVKLKIHGIQDHSAEGGDDVEVVCMGQMYEEDGFTYIKYDEVVDEEPNGLVQTVKNLLKIRDDQVEVIKEGPAASHMVFVPEQTTFTYYSTPLGELEISIYTKSMEKTEQERGFRLKLQYDLEMNQTFISSCVVDIEVEK